MNNNGYDWTTFKRKIYIKADRKSVFRAWATCSEIIKWFIARARTVDSTGMECDPSEIVKPGDTYYWEWHQDLSNSGVILDVVKDQLIRFTFGDKEKGSDEKIVVKVEFFDDDKGTRLELTQVNMADTPQAHVSWHMGCNMGWSFFMTNLKAYLEYGVDLRETDPQRAYDSRAINLL